VETRPGQTSWQTFDWMLRELKRRYYAWQRFLGREAKASSEFSAFNSRANAEEVARRLGESKPS